MPHFPRAALVCLLNLGSFPCCRLQVEEVRERAWLMPRHGFLRSGERSQLYLPALFAIVWVGCGSGCSGRMIANQSCLFIMREVTLAAHFGFGLDPC